MLLILQIKNPIFKAGIGNDILKSEEHNELAVRLQEYPLRFKTCNGVIKSVEAAKEERTRFSVLNIKRGILSTFQFQNFNKDNIEVNEVDVHGNCTSQYSRKGLYNRPTFTGQKVRQLNSCNELEESSSSGWLHSIKNMLPKSRDMIHSSSRCHYQFKNMMISRVTCEESHMFRPFSNKTSGAITTVTQNIRPINDDRVIIVRKNGNLNGCIFQMLQSILNM